MSSTASCAREIVEVCRWLHNKNLLAAADGNVSQRLENGNILITPSGVHKSFIAETDLAEITLDNHVIRGKPSSESLMHLEVYRRCPKAKAVVHAHPPTAIAWSIAKPEWEELPADCMSELILAVGRIPIAPYALPGTAEMANSFSDFLPGHRVIVLARHGAIAWGEDLMEAYCGMERLEHTAQILKFAQELGGLSSISPTEVDRLRRLRTELGDRTR